ncbi:peptidoglycan-binding domain-containing protein [Streptomyces flavalbus]|uniref:Peptidoglycan-binding protein n=1 Tax=Streptomyces flavalbus TaxID=2665155 RepID=A0ABW2W834_9ACTN
MAKPKGHPCPQCGEQRGTDNTPSCACGRRASDALHHARTAEQAAAEDFNPLRIRPYVDLGEVGEVADPGNGDAGDAGDTAGEAAETTMALHAVDAGDVGGAGNAGDATVVLRAVDADGKPTATAPVAEPTPVAKPADATSPLPTPLAPSATEPSATDLRLFEAGERADGPQSTAPQAPTPDGGRGSRRRRVALLGAAGAAVAVVAAAGLANGVFSYDTPTRDTAMPQDVREAVPDTSTNAATSAPPSTGAASSAAPTSASPSPSPSDSDSDSASASASPSEASPSASDSPRPSASASPPPTTAAATATVGPNGATGAAEGPVLRRGDRGPEVTELQQRLTKVWLWNGDTNGYYSHRLEDAVRTYQWSRGIQTDELGVYDAQTRAKLEAETPEL